MHICSSLKSCYKSDLLTCLIFILAGRSTGITSKFPILNLYNTDLKISKYVQINKKNLKLMTHFFFLAPLKAIGDYTKTRC